MAVMFSNTVACVQNAKTSDGGFYQSIYRKTNTFFIFFS